MKQSKRVFNPLDYPSIFGEPSRLTNITSWHEHIPFAFWIVAVLKPKTFVELGTHKGDSYGAFCQAVSQLGLPTRCYAVDTWKGDEHAGFYEEDVFTEFKAFHDQRYGQFSQLIRSTFDEALKHFSDGSIDLLHIDGLHTYEAVRHDLDCWLPKMSRSGIVLLHDTNVHERGFGVWKLWEKLKQKYRSFEFTHAHGLGILMVGNVTAEEVRALSTAQTEVKERIRKLFYMLGNRVALQRSNDQLQQTLAERDGQITALTKEHERATAWAKSLDAELATTRQHLAKLNTEHEKTASWGKKLDAELTTTRKRLVELNTEHEKTATWAKGLDAELATTRQRLAEFNTEITNLNQTVTHRDAQIAILNQAVAERDGQVANLNQAVAERDGQIANLNQVVAERDGHIAALQQSITQRDGQIASLNQLVAERETQIASLNQAMTDRDGQITRLMQDLAAILNSHSWRVTAPLRWCGLQARRAVRFWRAGFAAARDVGWAGLARRTLRVWREDGISGVKTLAGRRVALAASPAGDAATVVSSPLNDIARTPSTGKPEILFVSHDASRTGAPIFLLSLIARLAGRLNVACTILLARGGELEPEFRKLGTTIVLGDGNEMDPLVLDALERRNFRLAYFNTITNGALQARLRVLGCPILCHVHELAFSIEHFFGERNLKQVLASTDLFLAGSKAVRAHLEKWVEPDRVALAYPFIDTEANRRAASLASPPLDLPRGAVVVGACGTIGWRKGTDLFVQLARRVLATSGTPVVFVWLGGPLTHGEYRSLLYDAQVMGIEKHLVFPGQVDAHLPYFAQFDVFVLPSREDPFPLVMLDAASLGKPVVCFAHAGGAPEFVENDAGFVIPYLDVEAMAAAVQRLVDDPELRATLGGCARRKIMERHDISVGSEQFARTVHQFLAPQTA